MLIPRARLAALAAALLLASGPAAARQLPAIDALGEAPVAAATTKAKAAGTQSRFVSAHFEEAS